MENFDNIKCYAAKHDGPMECLVGKCTNREDQGNGFYLNVSTAEFGKVGFEWICMPCWNAVIFNETEHRFSQVYRNMKTEMFKPGHDVEEYYKDNYEGD